MKESFLPTVVLGIETPIGLAIIRDLGARGVTVHGIARDTCAIGLASRFLTKRHMRAAGNDALIKQLAALGEEIGEACLFAISESDITLLNRHRQDLPAYKFMFADARRMNRVLDKEQTYAAAHKIGIRVPRTRQIQSLAQVTAACDSLRFPVVLKWSNPNTVVKVLSAAGLRLDKAHYCYTAKELFEYLQPYEKVNVYPLIQEYCSGFGLGQIVLMHEGRARYLFQHQRVHEWPPEGGFSSLCKSLPLDRHHLLMEKSIALLRELEWEGVAMVEYRHDPVTNESALMEINGRFWGSLPLAYHSGASFPWFMYKLIGLKQAVDQQDYRAGMRCRFMIPETKRLMRLMFRQSDIADRRLVFKRFPELIGYFFDFLRPGTCYYVFDRRDPRPFLRDTIQVLWQIMPARWRSARMAGKT
jgi:predicted ATP-grasp superfamily ATP-dependent carboligase